MKEEIKKLKTGTTTVGIVCKDAVIMAADMQVTLGNVVSGKEIEKVYKINDKAVATISGTAGDALTVIRFLRSHAKLYEMEREEIMSAKAVVTFLANVLNANRYYPYLSAFIIGGFNKEPELYSTDPVGGYNKQSDYTADGSGFELVYGLLEQEYKEGLSEEDGIKLAIKSISIAKKRDIFTGGKSILVMVVDQSGVKKIPQDKVKRYIEELKVAKEK